MIEIYLRNGKHFKLIESFIAEEDGELYHSLIGQDDVTMLLQDTVLQSLKCGDVFLNSIILDIEKGLTVKHWSWLYEMAATLTKEKDMTVEMVLEIIKTYATDKNFKFVNEKNEEIEIDEETIVYFTYEHNSEIYEK